MAVEDSQIYQKAEKFAIRIVKLWKYLTNTKHEYEISTQLKRSGTSIGANTIEALYGASKKDFINKLYIAEKECNESKYWLKILYKTDYLTEEEYTSINNDCMEIAKILASIIKTSKKNLNFPPSTHNPPNNL